MTHFSYLDAPASSASALAALPSWLAAWFPHRYGEPTEPQRLAWPALAGDGNLLISAPTGTGKTWAALAPIIAELCSSLEPESFSTSPLRAVMVSPLKALVADTARGLEGDLADLEERLPEGHRLPRIAVRTGDSSAAERRALITDPPDLLLTTPESLAILLTRADMAGVFANLRWLLIDEAHAFASGKRGADLALSAERLSALACGPVRRVGLSATATPLPETARFVAGTGRPCSIVRAAGAVPPLLRLEPLPEGEKFLAALVQRIAKELPRHRSTLVFTNTRSLAERLAWTIRRRVPAFDGRIAVHHSALSARRRRETEQRFKRGELAAVVTSTSLELGIDIGSVGLAVLVHPPGDVVRLLQRVGRAGHVPGGLRHGLVLTASAAELLEAAVTCASARSDQCEPLSLPDAPLDVLCQHILGACCAGSRHPDDLFALFRQAAPYSALSRRDFDACIAYLRGLDCEGRVWLAERLREDGDCFRVKDAQTARLLRRNIGTILTDRTVSVALRSGEELSPVGEIDEAFAERLEPGARFLLDGRCLEFRSMQEGAAVVEEVVGRPRVPRWGGDGWPLSPQLAQRLYLLRTQAAEALREGPERLRQMLVSDYALTPEGAEMLAAYFQQQEAVSEVPDAGALLIEAVDAGHITELYFHTPLNRPGNDALARVALRRLARDLGRSAQSQVADLGLLLQVRGTVPAPADWARQLLAADGFRAELDTALRDSEAVRMRFGRVATTGLMVLRNPIGQQRKVGGSDWAGRELYERLRVRDPDFVLVRQSLREVSAELCSADDGEAFARRLPLLTVRCRFLRVPSPFAQAWTQQDAGPAAEAASPQEALLRLHAELTGGGDALA
jgi:ATP-dependent Lhr-like helicase